eukprot:scaffold103675_cov70-Phaeocystis_antarctica.AAC.11
MELLSRRRCSSRTSTRTATRRVESAALVVVPQLHFSGVPGLALQALGCATHSGRADEPLTSRPNGGPCGAAAQPGRRGAISRLSTPRRRPALARGVRGAAWPGGGQGGAHVHAGAPRLNVHRGRSRLQRRARPERAAAAAARRCCAFARGRSLVWIQGGCLHPPQLTRPH